MAWDLTEEAKKYIAPTLYREYLRVIENAEKQGFRAPEDAGHSRLCDLFAEQRKDRDDDERDSSYQRFYEEARKLSVDVLINEIASGILKFNSMTNGGQRVYVDEGWVTLPWCSEQEMLAYYGGPIQKVIT